LIGFEHHQARRFGEAVERYSRIVEMRPDYGRHCGWLGDIDLAIAAELEAADVIVLLVSPNFIASNYCYEKKMTRAVERASRSRKRGRTSYR
jgi:hypothetical protein